MLLIRYDFTRLNAVYFMCSKVEVTKYFSQYLADYRFTGVPSPVEVVRTDDAAESRVERLLIFAGNGVSDKSSLLQIARHLMA